MPTRSIAPAARHTADSIRALLDRNPRAIEKAIVALYARQTADEQSTETTRHSNARGFNAADAKRLSFIATFLANGGHLKTETCARYLPRVRKYAAQLAAIANEKAAVAAANAEAEAEAEAA